jgi:hypothetical protein
MYQKGLFGPGGDGSIDPQVVQEILENINPYLWASLTMPFDDLQERRSIDSDFLNMTEGESAVWLRPKIVRLANRIFENNDAIQFHNIRQQKFWTYQDRLAFSFKKIKWYKPRRGPQYLARSNYRTSQNVDFWSQRSMEGFPDLPRILISYLVVDELTDIKVIVGLPEVGTKKFRWTYVMPDQNEAVIRLEADYQTRRADHHDDEDDRGFIVRPRRNVFGNESKNA